MLAAGFIGGRGRESLFQQLFNAVLLPVQATMFALLAFYLASASFRAFRTRSLDATVLLVSAVIVMIGRLDDGQTLHLPDISRWILNSPEPGREAGDPDRRRARNGFDRAQGRPRDRALVPRVGQGVGDGRARSSLPGSRASTDGSSTRSS